MRKILLAILLFSSLSFAQSTWEMVKSTYGVWSNFTSVGDTLYYVDSQNILNKVYKGLVGTAEIKNELSNVFFSATGSGSCSGATYWGAATIAAYNGTLYNFGTYTGYYCGFWVKNTSGIENFDPSSNTATQIYRQNLTAVHKMAALQQHTIPLVGDSLIYLYRESGTTNGYLKQSISSGTYSGSSVASLTDTRGGYYRYIAGDFVLADTLYAISSYKNNEYSNVFLDTMATVWKRNPITYAWTQIHDFAGAGYLFDIQEDTTNNEIYFLLGSNDTTNVNIGVWKFDGTTFTQMPKPPSDCMAQGFLVTPTEYYVSVAMKDYADSNKVYRYFDSTWEAPQTIHSSTVGDTGNILIRNIWKVNNTLFLGWKPFYGTQSSLGTGVTDYVAYDTTYYSIVLSTPTPGYYSDSLLVRWMGNMTPDSVTIAISYDSAATFTDIDTVVNIDSAWIPIQQDSIARHSFIKITDMRDSQSVYSPEFVVYNKWLTLDTVYFSNDTVAYVIQSAGIGGFQAYYSPDSTTWTLVRGFTIEDSSAIVTDTLRTKIPIQMNGTNSYWRVTEVMDTAVYGKSLFLAGKGSIGYFLSYYSTNWVLSGNGAHWIKDPGAGWVANITMHNGTSTFSIGTSGMSLTYTEVPVTKTERDAPGFVWPYPITGQTTNFQDATTGMIILGRNYYVSGDTVYMTDEVNHITYPVYNTGGFWWSATADPLRNVRYINNINGYIVLVTNAYGTVYAFKALSYPPLAGSVPRTSSFHLVDGSGTAHDATRGYFRGIDPIIKR